MQLKGSFATYLCGVLAVALASSVHATSRPKAIDAAVTVMSHNVTIAIHNDDMCHARVVNPQRPDRKRLARLVATLPDPNALYDFGYQHANAQVLAVLTDDVDLLRAQFARGGRLDTPELQSMAMGIAAQWSGPSMIEALARHGVSPNAHDADMETPLMATAWHDDLANVRTLLLLGADPNIGVGKGANVRTALDGAVFCRNAAMVRALLEHGARTDVHSQRIEQKFGTHLVDDARRSIRSAH